MSRWAASVNPKSWGPLLPFWPRSKLPTSPEPPSRLMAAWCGRCYKEIDRGKCGFKISFATLQTKASFAATAKLMLNLQKSICKKETGRCPGGKHDRLTQIRGVWGKSWVLNTFYRNSFNGQG